MTRTLASDPTTNDLALNTAGDLYVLEGLAAIAANARTAVQAQRGEMIYRMRRGMPTAQTAWSRYSPEQFKAALRATLLRVTGVRAVNALVVRRVGDVLRYTATLSTEVGELQIDG